MKFITIIFSLFIFLSTLSLAQVSSEPSVSKNIIHASIGTGVLSASVSGYYDRLISEHMKKRDIATYLRIGLGAFSDAGDDDGSYLLLQSIWLTGRNKNHLEGGIGFSFLQKSNGQNTSTELEPAALIGYRYQKIGRKFLFRTGIGYPESIYIGLGISF